MTSKHDEKIILRDLQGSPIPQYFNLVKGDYEELSGIEGCMNISSMQKKWRSSFKDTSLWDIVQTGAGMTIDTAAVPGELKLSTGTTINSETILRSKEIFRIPFRAMFGHMLSQRIANQEFYMELVSVDPETGVPDGLYSAAILCDGTSATQSKYSVQNSGFTALTSAASTFTTTAAYSLYEVELFADEAWFHSKVMDSTAARSNSYVRHQQIPDPNAYYKIQIRAKNLGVAPASNTDWKFQFVNVNDYAELTAEVTAGRGNTVAGQGIYATIAGTVTASSTSGVAAHDAGISGNPVRIGARAVTANYTGVSGGDVADLIATVVGAQIVKQYSIPEGDWQFACAAPLTTTADTVLKAAGAAGIRNYLTAIQIINTHLTVETEIVIKDGATVIWRGWADNHPASTPATPIIINFPTPLKGTAATALNIACVTNGANVYVNAQGYQAP